MRGTSLWPRVPARRSFGGRDRWRGGEVREHLLREPLSGEVHVDFGRSVYELAGIGALCEGRGLVAMRLCVPGAHHASPCCLRYAMALQNSSFPVGRSALVEDPPTGVP